MYIQATMRIIPESPFLLPQRLTNSYSLWLNLMTQMSSLSLYQCVLKKSFFLKTSLSLSLCLLQNPSTYAFYSNWQSFHLRSLLLSKFSVSSTRKSLLNFKKPFHAYHLKSSTFSKNFSIGRFFYKNFKLLN